MADLLLELFSEEIPARMQAQALADLKSLLDGHLQKTGFKPADAEGYVTPRRLALWLKGLPAELPATETELKGPKVGAPDAAVEGFLKKSGLSRADLTERDGAYFAIVKKDGQKTESAIKSALEDILPRFPWPKSMRWGSRAESWVRPLHSILCLFDGKVIPVQFAGITASNVTYGHRFLSPAAITITKPEEYKEKLRAAHVIADRAERKAYILAEARKLASAKGLTMKQDEGLLEEVTGLVEWPVPLAGRIDAGFMDLPREVLISEMRAHQKYFALETSDGSLADTFLITANITAADGGKAIIAGNERVLRARLADGRFFWDQDRKKKLSDWAEGLKSVTYHAKTYEKTIHDRVENRIRPIAMSIAESVKGTDKELVEQAARLCKADLTTGMVGEFPELQGVMGRYYALQQKIAPTIADAIRDHYKPQGPSDGVPNQPISICLAIADKLDSIVGLFSIGEKPTGSKDPFALRRAALGIVRIVRENNLRIALKREIQYAGMRRTTDSIQQEILEFFIDRLKVQLKDEGIRHDVISAVTSAGDDDILRIVAKAKALQDFLATEDGLNLLAGYRRAANILAIEEKKDGKTYAAKEMNASVLKEKEETALAQLLPDMQNKLLTLVRDEKFEEAAKQLASLRAPIDLFFDKIMVNCEDKDLRTNRLRLLSAIRESVDSIANFALLEGETKETKKKAA